MQKLSHPLLGCFLFWCCLSAGLTAFHSALPDLLCLQISVPIPTLLYSFLPVYIQVHFYLLFFPALQTILLWRRQSKTWPPCITLVDLWCLAHECTWLPLRLWMFLHHRLFLCLSWHGFYVFFTSSSPTPTSLHPPPPPGSSCGPHYC